MLNIIYLNGHVCSSAFVCVLLFMVHAQIINETITNLPDNILAGQKAVTSSYYFYPFFL